MFSVYFIFPVFKAYQLFLLEINAFYNLILNMEMFTYQVINISSQILPFSYPFWGKRGEEQYLLLTPSTPI